MKIYIISPFNPYRGGIAQFSDELAKSLEDKVEIEEVNYQRLYPTTLFPGKSQFVDESLGKQVTTKKGLDSLNPFSGIRLLKKIKKENKTNVLLTVYWMSFFSPLLSFLTKWAPNKTKKIALIHNLIPHEKRFFDSFLTKLYVRQQDAFVVLSEKVKNDVLKMRPNAKVLQLFHPLYDHFGAKIDKDNARVMLNLPKESKILLFFGLIRDYKGLDVLLNALTLLDNSYFLVIAGECYGSFEKYQLLIDKNKLNERVKYIDKFIPDSEVSVLFSAADLCVLPYKTATQSGVTATALHFNIPIISTQVGGLSEYVIDGKTGFLVPPNNSQLFADSILKIKNDEMFLQMKDEIKSFKKQLSWDVFASELKSFIQSI